ncbi:acyl carrier protein [Paraliomyxa miuraensis]|uniref:acyl carrier protein n=1 Tax=Paraliomyxa miuraensis TaxID=376150 RepID=UPI0022510843|nr:acyl carrier protein [Paraliomyxa miuraensis]MCX4247049.1 acyl carrier protein [Paraliomyxa miuraensis]
MPGESRQEVFDVLVAKMVEMFELEPGSITAETHLFEDLDLDSIDAIDLAVQLQEFTGKKVGEESLRSLRTVGDVVDLVVALRSGESA